MPGITESSARGVAQGARDADRRERAGIDLALDADDGVQPNELDRRGGIVQIVAGEEAWRQRLAVDVQTDTQGIDGLTAVWMTSCICSRSVQSCSSPKVS